VPKLDWLTRSEDEKVSAHVRYRLLEAVPEHSYGDPGSENMLIHLAKIIFRVDSMTGVQSCGTGMLRNWSGCLLCRALGMLENLVYTVAEAAALTGFSRSTATRLFQRERGVLVRTRPSANRKRRYRSIRIPRSVYERVINRLRVK
jgi:hypothetical protein